MPEEEVSAGPKGDGGDGAPGSQLSLVIPVLTNVVMAVLVPVDQHKVEGLSSHQRNAIPDVLQNRDPGLRRQSKA